MIFEATQHYYQLKTKSARCPFFGPKNYQLKTHKRRTLESTTSNFSKNVHNFIINAREKFNGRGLSHFCATTI